MSYYRIGLEGPLSPGQRLPGSNYKVAEDIASAPSESNMPGIASIAAVIVGGFLVAKVVRK